MNKIYLLIIWILLLSFRSDKPVNILIIGDSISIGYTPWVNKALAGKAYVTHNSGNARNTGFGLENLESWVGNTDWDIIQFNWGLWDLCYRNPNSNNHGHRDKINGQLTTSLEKYKENLDSLVQILQTLTTAKLIFVTTTYVPDNEAGRFKEDAIKYNNAAIEIMEKYGIKVNDIYYKSVTIHNNLGKAANDVHYTNEGYNELSKLVIPILLEEIEKLKLHEL